MHIPSAISHAIRLPTVTLVLACVTGCAANNTFIQPEEASSAKLRVVQSNPDKYGILLGEMDLKTCQLRSQVGFVSQGGQTDTIRVGMYDGAPPIQDGILERRIPVDEPFAVVPKWFVALVSFGTTLFAMSPGGGANLMNEMASKTPGECRFPVFLPKQGEQYEISIDIAPGKCDVALHQLVQLPSESAIRRPLAPMSNVIYQLAGVGYPEGKCQPQQTSGS